MDRRAKAGRGWMVQDAAAVRQLLHPGTGHQSLVLSGYYKLGMDGNGMDGKDR